MGKGSQLTLPAAVPGGWTYQQLEGVNNFNAYSVLMSKVTYSSAADFGTLITRALQRFALLGGVVDYDATRMTNLGLRILSEINCLINMKLQNLFEVWTPAVAADDTSTTAPFEPGTALGLKSVFKETLFVSDIARYIAGIMTQPVQVAGPVPGEDSDAAYWIPILKSKSAATMETLRATIRSYDDGLQMASQLKIPYSLAVDEDFEIADPVSIYSDLGAMLTYFSSFKEDNTTTETTYDHAFDATTDVIFHQMFGMSAFYDLAVLLATTALSRTGVLVEPLAHIATIATDTCSLSVANRESTAFADLAVNDSLSSILYNGAVATSLAWILEGSLSQTVSNIAAAAATWDERLESFLSKYADKPAHLWPQSYGLQPLPPTVSAALNGMQFVASGLHSEGAKGGVKVQSKGGSGNKGSQQYEESSGYHGVKDLLVYGPATGGEPPSSNLNKKGVSI